MKVCNRCGKILSVNCISIDEPIGYGSSHDGDMLAMDLCYECLDDIYDAIKPMCKHDPIVEINV